MVDTRLLERMLELNLLESVLTRGDLTKKLISQGILGDMLELDIIEAMVKPANVPVLFQLLEGELLQVKTMPPHPFNSYRKIAPHPRFIRRCVLTSCWFGWV
jgi:hypothetical protein